MEFDKTGFLMLDRSKELIIDWLLKKRKCLSWFKSLQRMQFTCRKLRMKIEGATKLNFFTWCCNNSYLCTYYEYVWKNHQKLYIKIWYKMRRKKGFVLKLLDILFWIMHLTTYLVGCDIQKRGRWIWSKKNVQVFRPSFSPDGQSKKFFETKYY